MRLISGFLTALILALPCTEAAGEMPQLVNLYSHSDNFYTSGQPRETDFAALAAFGVQVVVNMSPANLPASLKNERELVERQGMAYHFIPVDWDRPSIEDVRRFFEVMDDSKGKSVLVHCWVNARSSGLAYLYRTIRLGLPESEERAVLAKIWNNNHGYELRNVPVWRTFFEEARRSLR